MSSVMGEEDLSDFCIICRDEEEEGERERLMQPCMCKGSTGFIHQSCLNQWLTRSSTEKCQVCNHFYEFTNIYGNPPTKLRVLKRALNSIISILILCPRFILIIILWLGLLPSAICYLLRWFVLITSAEVITPLMLPEMVPISNQNVNLASIFDDIIWLWGKINSSLEAEEVLEVAESIIEDPSSSCSRFGDIIADILSGRRTLMTIIAIGVIGLLIKTEIGRLDRLPSQLAAERAVIASQVAFIAAHNGARVAALVDLHDEPLELPNLTGQNKEGIKLRKLPPPLNATQSALSFGFTLPASMGSTRSFESRGSSLQRVLNSLFEIVLEIWREPSIYRSAFEVVRTAIFLGVILSFTVLCPLALARYLVNTDLLLFPIRFLGAIRKMSEVITFEYFGLGIRLLFASIKTLPRGARSLLAFYFPKSPFSMKVIYHFGFLVKLVLRNITPTRVQAALRLTMEICMELTHLCDGIIVETKGLWNVIYMRICMRMENSSIETMALLVSCSLILSLIDLVHRAPASGDTLLLMTIFFVFIELVAFPLFCGFTIYAVTISLFSDDITPIRDFQDSLSPLSTLLLTWLGGTCFTLSFSFVVDSIRRRMRPGLLWFIRYPSSIFLPLGGIMRRKASVQFKRSLNFIFLHVGVILAVFGSAVLFLNLFFAEILPLQWSYRSFHSICFDLFVIVTITPLTFDALYLTSTLRKIFIKNVDNTARALRLSSLLFGKRQAIEEIILQVTFARVPATDNIRIRPARKMFIPCQKDGTSLTEEGRGWIEDQVFEMATTRPRDQYELIYLPKNWKWRVAGFVFLNWASTMLVALSGFVTLLLTGRFLFSYDLNGLHSLMLLGYFLLCVTYLTRSILSNFKRTRRQNVLALQSIFLMTTLPISLSLIMNCFIVLPLNSNVTFSEILEIPLDTLFSEGLLLGSILVQIIWRTRLLKNLKVKLEDFKVLWKSEREGDKMKAMELLTPFLFKLFLPVLILMVFIPLLSTLIINLIFQIGGQESFDNITRIIFQTASVLFPLVCVRANIKNKLIVWIDKVRGDEFLIGRKLKNYVAPLSL